MVSLPYEHVLKYLKVLVSYTGSQPTLMILYNVWYHTSGIKYNRWRTCKFTQQAYHINKKHLPSTATCLDKDLPAVLAVVYRAIPGFKLGNTSNCFNIFGKSAIIRVQVFATNSTTTLYSSTRQKNGISRGKRFDLTNASILWSTVFNVIGWFIAFVFIW